MRLVGDHRPLPVSDICVAHVQSQNTGATGIFAQIAYYTLSTLTIDVP